MIQLRWSSKEWSYVAGETAYVGRWAVANIFYDGLVSKDSKYRWGGNILVPGIRLRQTHYLKRKEVKAAVETAIRWWFKECGLPFRLKRRKRIIGIVGTRRRDSDYDFRLVENEFLRHYHIGDTICSGYCSTGADRFAVILADKYGTPKIWHHAKWRKYGKGAGFQRNTLIANDSNVLIACVAEDRKGGTEDTLRKFKKLGKRNWYII